MEDYEIKYQLHMCYLGVVYETAKGFRKSYPPSALIWKHVAKSWLSSTTRSISDSCPPPTHIYRPLPLPCLVFTLLSWATVCAKFTWICFLICRNQESHACLYFRNYIFWDGYLNHLAVFLDCFPLVKIINAVFILIKVENSFISVKQK